MTRVGAGRRTERQNTYDIGGQTVFPLVVLIIMAARVNSFQIGLIKGNKEPEMCHLMDLRPRRRQSAGKPRKTDAVLSDRWGLGGASVAAVGKQR